MAHPKDQETGKFIIRESSGKNKLAFGKVGTTPGKVKNKTLRRVLILFSVVIGTFLVMVLIKKAFGLGDDGQKPDGHRQAQIVSLVPSTSINPVTDGPVLVWNPQDIVRKDSMLVDTNFRSVDVPEWAFDKTLPGRKYEHYAQTMDFRFKTGEVVTVGPCCPDLDPKRYKWADLDKAQVRMNPDGGRKSGILYFVQRES